MTRAGYALGTDDARSQDGVAERRFPKAVTDIVDPVFGVGVSGRRPRKFADPRVGRVGRLGKRTAGNLWLGKLRKQYRGTEGWSSN